MVIFLARSSFIDIRQTKILVKNNIEKTGNYYEQGKLNPLIIRNFINKSLEMYQWLDGKGLKFEHLAAKGNALLGQGSGLPMHMFEAKLDKDMAIGRGMNRKGGVVIVIKIL